MAYARDPYWTTARFASTCAQWKIRPLKTHCAPIRKGSRIYYYPASRSVICESCGTTAAADFAANVADEDAYNGR